MTTEEREAVCKNFEIPAVASGLLEFFFEPAEIAFILDNADRTFSKEEIGTDFAEREYRRGLISKTDESGQRFRLNTFYYFLDVFVVGRKKVYDRLSTAQKKALDDWYFDAYFATLDKALDRPTSDRVLPLREMLERIERDDRPVYLNDCDCRSLTGECGAPVRTCITYKNGINSFVDRGLSEKIDRERAKEIVIEADRAGLMHTVAMGGICNCCGDCCYLFRSLKRLGSAGRWPASDNIVRMDPERCVSCGKCVSRCHFGIFQREGRAVRLHPEECVGCGLCVNTCPTGALSLMPRADEKKGKADKTSGLQSV